MSIDIVRHDSGTTLHLSDDAAELIAVLLGRTVDMTDDALGEEMYEALVDAGFDESLGGEWNHVAQKFVVKVSEQGGGPHENNADKYIVGILDKEN